MSAPSEDGTTLNFLKRGNFSHLYMPYNSIADKATIRVKNYTDRRVFFVIGKFRNSKLKTTHECLHQIRLEPKTSVDLTVKAWARIVRSKRHRIFPYLPRKNDDGARSREGLGRKNVVKLSGCLKVYKSWTRHQYDSDPDFCETITLFAHLPREASAKQSTINFFVSSA